MARTILNGTDERFNGTSERINETVSYILPLLISSPLKSQRLWILFRFEHFSGIFVASKNVGNLKHSTIIFLVGVVFSSLFFEMTLN